MEAIMKATEVLNRALSASGLSKSDLSRVMGVSRVTVTRTMAADNPMVQSVVRYLDAMGYKLWAVPESLHLNAICDDCMEIDADIPTKE